MKKLLLLLSAVCFVATSASAINLKPYVEGRLTNTWSKAKMTEVPFGNSVKLTDNSVLGGAIAVGTSIDPFRVELETFFNGTARHKIDYFEHDHLKAYGVFLNGYYDIGTFNGFTPYVGAGIGYSWFKNEVTHLGGPSRHHDSDLGYNVGAGVAYSLTDNTAITLGYRYEDLGKIRKEWEKTEIKGHKVLLGLRYTF